MAQLDMVKSKLSPTDGTARDQLEILRKAAKAELSEFFSGFINRLKTPDAFKEEILPKRIYEHFEEYRVDIEDSSTAAIDGIVRNFFSGSEDQIKSGFINIIKYAFSTIFGSTVSGEQRTSNWFITIEYGALIRVDVMAWRYNFSSNTVVANLKNAFCFTIIKSFVDASTLTSNEIQFFVAKSLGLKTITDIQKDETLKSYVEYLVKSWSTAKSFTVRKFSNVLSKNKK
jgi:hypothetical protein